MVLSYAIDRIRDNAKLIIGEDKEGYLSGYVSEICFLKRYIELYGNRNYSTKWCCFIPRHVCCKSKKFINGNPKFVVFNQNGKLNTVDLSVVRHLCNFLPGKYNCLNQRGMYECLLAGLEDDKFSVYRLYLGDDRKEVVKEKWYSVKLSNSFSDSFIRMSLGTSNKSNHASKDGIYNRAIKFLEDEGLLVDKAILNFMVYVFKVYHGFTVDDIVFNLDVVGENDFGVPVYYEIKFQADGSWSNACIGRAQVEQGFHIFCKSGMSARNVVLLNNKLDYKPITKSDKKWELIFNLLDSCHNDFSKLRWKYKDFTDPDLKFLRGEPKFYDKVKRCYQDSNEEDCNCYFYPLSNYLKF